MQRPRIAPDMRGAFVSLPQAAQPRRGEGGTRRAFSEHRDGWGAPYAEVTWGTPPGATRHPPHKGEGFHGDWRKPTKTNKPKCPAKAGHFVVQSNP